MGLKVETEYQTEDGPQSLPNKSSLERGWRGNRKIVISLWVLEMLSEFILSLSLANSRVIKISVYYIYNGKKMFMYLRLGISLRKRFVLNLLSVIWFYFNLFLISQ